jgi:hypothetical protein
LTRDDPPARVVDQRPMGAHHRVGRHPGTKVVRRRAGLLGQQGGQRAGVAGQDLSLPRLERRALDDRARQRREPLARLRVRAAEQAALGEQEAPERRQRGLARRAVADGLQQLVLEGAEPPVDEVLLTREVVEDGLLGDVGGARDLGHGHALEPALGEEPPCGLGDLLERALLLARAEAELGHVRELTSSKVSCTQTLESIQ